MLRKSPRKSPRKCPKGTIKRSPYTAVRRKHKKSPKPTVYHVKATCVKDVGKPGKGKRVIPPLKSGRMSKFGYHGVKHLTVAQRHAALDAAKDAVGAATAVEMVNALYVLNKNMRPKLAAIYEADRDYLHQFTAAGQEESKE